MTRARLSLSSRDGRRRLRLPRRDGSGPLLRWRRGRRPVAAVLVPEPQPLTALGMIKSAQRRDTTALPSPPVAVSAGRNAFPAIRARQRAECDGAAECLPPRPAAVSGGIRLSFEQDSAVAGICIRAVAHKAPFAMTGNPLMRALVGPAGSGKTTTTRDLSARLEVCGFTVGYAAPTHKACSVMAKSLGVERDRVITVASLLGLREQIWEDQLDFVPSAPHRMKEAVAWIIDESSMLHPEHLELINRHAETRQVFVFVGDAAQLPPVGHDQSPALQIADRYELTKVHRHAGAVLELATEIRSGEQFRPAVIPTNWSHGTAVIVHPNVEAWQTAFLSAVLAAGRENPDAARVLAYRNATVDGANAAIRRTLLGADAPSYVVGERLICNGAAFDHNAALIEGSPPTFGSCQELTILGIKEVRTSIDVELKDGHCFVDDGFLLTVGTDEGKTAELLALADPSSVENALQWLRARRMWKGYWRLKRSFPKLNRHWAMTTHKSQGSQFGQVFVDTGDLDTARRDDRRRLWYTAVTRATQAVHVVGRQPPP